LFKKLLLLRVTIVVFKILTKYLMGIYTRENNEIFFYKTKNRVSFSFDNLINNIVLKYKRLIITYNFRSKLKKILEKKY